MRRKSTAVTNKEDGTQKPKAKRQPKGTDGTNNAGNVGANAANQLNAGTQELNKPVSQQILGENAQTGPAQPKKTGTKAGANPDSKARLNVRNKITQKLHKGIPESTVAQWQKRDANLWLIED